MVVALVRGAGRADHELRGGDVERDVVFEPRDLRHGITRLIECGGSLASEPNDTPDDPLHLAMCIDPEGNEFMMTQRRS